MSSILGKGTFSLADLADATAVCNLVYPNGIGKKEGVVVFGGAAGSRQMYMATGSLAADPWLPIHNGEQIDLTVTWTANEPTAVDTKTVADGNAITDAEMGVLFATLIDKLNAMTGAITPS